MFSTVQIDVDRDTKSMNVTYTRHTGTPTLATMQAAVGGSIERGFELASPTRPGITLDYWVNEDGLAVTDSPVMRYRSPDLDAGYGVGVITLAGNGIYSASNEDGETVAMRADEIKYVYKIKMYLAGFTH